MPPEDPDNAEQTPDRVFLSAALFELALAALALFLGWAIGPSARATVPELVIDEVWPILSNVLLGCVAAGPILLFVEIIRRIPWEPIRELERLTDDGMLRTLLQLRPPELIMVSICAGIGEELLFRGWLMYWLADLVGLADFSGGADTTLAIGIALGLSSLVFGLFHPITKLYVVLAALMGLYFGGLVLYTGNLLVPIAAHATYDAVQLILTARNERLEASQAA
ncbi:CPBP family intramembrane metalloprotease [bacterium]|nr:CPBP family intramembrane metalloprotease [Rhodopirellula sp.]MDB4540344.1 CPBP family intramembrane metalloprotease [bacterium]